MPLRYTLLGLLAVLLLAPAAAAGHLYVASLAGANEVPAVVTSATGTVVATVGDDGTTVTITGRFSGLESDYRMSHIHIGPAGSNGGVIFPLVPTVDDDSRGGTFEAANNTFTFSADQITALESDGLYINIHSADNGGGEIRGQLGAPGGLANVSINEIDADQTSTDTAEFVELYNGGTEPVALDSAVLVLFNGSDDASYQAFDLDGFTIAPGDFFVFCNESDNVPNCDLEANVADNLIQNGADAVALVLGDAASFPNDTPVSPNGVLTAVVYGTSDADDAELLAAFGQTVQVDENANGMKDTESIQRSPDGSDTFVAAAPTPGATNGGVVSVGDDPEATLSLSVPNPIRGAAVVRFALDTPGDATLTLYDALGRRVATLAEGALGGDQEATLDAAALAAGVYVLQLRTDGAVVARTVTVVR